jgi:hypothetical protein
VHSVVHYCWGQEFGFRQETIGPHHGTQTPTIPHPGWSPIKSVCNHIKFISTLAAVSSAVVPCACALSRFRLRIAGGPRGWNPLRKNKGAFLSRIHRPVCQFTRGKYGFVAGPEIFSHPHTHTHTRRKSRRHVHEIDVTCTYRPPSPSTDHDPGKIH